MHIKEGVPWKDIEFADNQPAIELLEKPPQGPLVSQLHVVVSKLAREAAAGSAS